MLLGLMHWLATSWWPHLASVSVVLQTALKWLFFPHLLHFLPQVGHCLCRFPAYSICSSVLFTSYCYYLFTVYYYHVSACLFLLSQTLLHPWYCLAPPSVSTVPLLSGHTSIILLLTSLVPFKAVNSFIIYVFMFSSSRPFINCSFSLVS